MLYTQLQQLLAKAITKLYPEAEDLVYLEHPNDPAHGDYATNVAMRLSKTLQKNPREIAQAIVDTLSHHEELSSLVSKLEIAGPGFINFYLHPKAFADQLKKMDEKFGTNQTLSGKKAIVEYTDPNPFKVLHIGHLMSNTIGESLSRVLEWSGAEVKRVCYQGDVGMHVAKALWGLLDLGEEQIPKKASLSEQVAYLGKAYAHGATVYKEGSKDQQTEITRINKQVYEQSDARVHELYQWGRQVSLDYFETQYAQLGTKFDEYFFESKVAETGVKAVKEFLDKGVFEESDGAIVFRGEEHGLHTRVFINSEGLPTYEAKELGLAKEKFDFYPYDLSLVVTGNEINQYFQVLLTAMSFVFPELAKKTEHIGHGMLRLPEGKMSSRTGSVIAAEDLIEKAVEMAKEKESRAEKDISLPIAIAAIKFSILSQSAGSNIIFDFEKSLSFEGDSGPYLQYTYARCQSILRKANEEGLKPNPGLPENWESTELERLLYRLPETVSASLQDRSTHHVAHFLLQVAHEFNSWYGKTKIVDQQNPSASYLLALTQATAQVLKNGLWILGINVLEEM